MSRTPTIGKDKARQIELILAELDSLPTLPAVAARLLELTSDSGSHAKQVVQLVESDQSLTAKILSLARRAGTGAGGSVSTVDRAVVLMGFDAIRNAVLSIKVFETFGPRARKGESTFDRAEFWKHSLAVACAAHLIAQKRTPRVDPEEAFVCGLLHDLGKVALDACLPKSFDRVVALADSSRACIADVERRILGLDHTTAGKHMGERWALPEAIVQSMWLHHQSPEALPASIACAEHVKIVHLADLLTRQQRIGYSGNWPINDPPKELAGRLGVPEERYDQILRDLPDHISARAAIVGLEDLTSEDVYSRALEQANEELTRLNASLNATNHRLQTHSRYFQALAQLTESLSLRPPMQQVCLSAARSVRHALKLDSVLVFARYPEDGYVELALVDPQREEPTCEPFAPEDDCLLAAEMETSTVEATTGGAWIVQAVPQAQALLDRYVGQLGDGPHWLFPIVRDRQWVGGAIFSARGEVVASRRSETDELASFSTAIGLVMANTRARQAADRLSEDLAEVGRRMQQMQAQLLQTRSLSMIGEMAAGAAHELNNPLAVITGRAQLLRQQAGDPEVCRQLDLISEQAHRCSEIVTELMAFAKPQHPEPEPTSLATVLAKTRAAWVSKTWLTDDRFELQLSDSLPAVWFDPAQLEQVLDELISNAVAAMNPGVGRLSVNCRAEPSDDRVVLTVEDNGCGMEADVLQKAFDPFFSHRPAGRSRGLGLARAFRLVDGNAGRLSLESTPGRGTTAVLELPTEQRRAGGQTGSLPSPLSV